MTIEDFYMVASNPAMEQKEPGLPHVLFSGESQTKPGHRLGPKVYDFYLMHLVLSGKGVFTVNGESHELSAGHTFLIAPEQLISYESHPSDPWKYRWIAFKGNSAPQLAADAGFQTNSQLLHMADIRKASVLYRRIYAAFRKSRPSVALEASATLLLLLALYGETNVTGEGVTPLREAESERLYKQIVHYMSTQYAYPVSIERMSESLGYNRAYLSRLFKRHTGLSPVSFLLKLRLDKAKLMLRERPELTVEQVAASVGLQDALYFSKQFRKQHGASPTAYRKQVLGDS
ncbi:AraC family ligand binding domain-containing protein [Paenibacillus sp. CAU 1782]